MSSATRHSNLLCHDQHRTILCSARKGGSKPVCRHGAAEEALRPCVGAISIFVAAVQQDFRPLAILLRHCALFTSCE
jgi:hypothetical protein